MLKFSGVTLRYSGSESRGAVVEDVSFSSEGGRIVGLIGPSGIGKSTVLRAAAGLLKPITGKIERGASTRECVWLLPQAPMLLSFRTTLENALFGRELTRRLDEEDLSTAKSLVERLGLKDHECRFPPQLSGGMRRRVAVAQALLSSRQLLLMDEPLAEMDFSTRIAVEEEIWKTVRMTNSACVIASHDVDSLVAISDDIVLLQAPTPARAIEFSAVNLSIASGGDPASRRRDSAFPTAVAQCQRLIWEHWDD